MLRASPITYAFGEFGWGRLRLEWGASLMGRLWLSGSEKRTKYGGAPPILSVAAYKATGTSLTARTDLPSRRLVGGLTFWA